MHMHNQKKTKKKRASKKTNERINFLFENEEKSENKRGMVKKNLLVKIKFIQIY